jgi:hypothetical protein
MERRRSLFVPAFRVFAGLCLATVVMLSAACSENPVGRKCFIDTPNLSDDVTIVSSPALECPSRTCLRVPRQTELPPGSEYTNLCSAECNSDDDCDRVPESPCQTGFTCTIPSAVGKFCCRKMCVCKDYLIIPDGGVIEPAECDPGDETNKCCNLPGRTDLPECQTI